MRVYDPRIGRFLSTDPLQTQFPDLTPYQFAGNTPIQAVDLDGREPKGFMINWRRQGDEVALGSGNSVQNIYDSETKRYWSVMHYPNTGDYYYWKTNYEKAHSLFVPHNTSLNRNAEGQWTGVFQRFRPKMFGDDKSLYYGALGMLATPFVAMGVIGGGAIAATAVEGQALNLIVKGVTAYYKYAPVVGSIGMKAAEFLDESGSVGLTNTAVATKAAKAMASAASRAKAWPGYDLYGDRKSVV